MDVAAGNGQLEVVRYLTEVCKLDPGMEDGTGMHRAAMENKVGVIRTPVWALDGKMRNLELNYINMTLNDERKKTLSRKLQKQTEYNPDHKDVIEEAFVKALKKNFIGCEELSIGEVLSWCTPEVMAAYKEESSKKKDAMIKKNVDFSRKAERMGQKALHLSRGVLKAMFVCTDRNWATATWYSMTTKKGHTYYLGTEIAFCPEALPGLCEGIMFEVEMQTPEDKDLAYVARLSDLDVDLRSNYEVFYGVDPDTREYELKTSGNESVDAVKLYKKDMFQIEAWLGELKGLLVRTTGNGIQELPSKKPTKGQLDNLSRYLRNLQKLQKVDCVQRFELKRGRLQCTVPEELPEHIQEKMTKIYAEIADGN